MIRIAATTPALALASMVAAAAPLRAGHLPLGTWQFTVPGAASK